jgi:hypothetical protein
VTILPKASQGASNWATGAEAAMALAEEVQLMSAEPI